MSALQGCERANEALPPPWSCRAGRRRLVGAPQVETRPGGVSDLISKHLMTSEPVIRFSGGALVSALTQGHLVVDRRYCDT